MSEQYLFTYQGSSKSCSVDSCPLPLAFVPSIRCHACSTSNVDMVAVCVQAIQRKSCLIADNMSKLVDDPVHAAPFLPSVMPLVKRVSEEVADPEVRLCSFWAVWCPLCTLTVQHFAPLGGMLLAILRPFT